MMEECTICLEPILAHADVGVVSGCRHHYHEQCLLQWCSHSNSCPSCRKLFYAVFVVNQATGTVRQRISIQNKILLTDAIDNIPLEFVNPSQPPEDDEPTIGVCSLCSSSDIRALTMPMLTCNSCFAGFHLLCLGIANVRDVGMDPTWCCPMCDSSQHVVISGRPAHRPAATARRPRASETTAAIERREERPVRQGLVIHNENGELDDSFLYNENPPRPVLLNGGILSRRETRQWQSLSPEEMQSWEMFHHARQGAEHEYLVPSPANNTRRKRRKRYNSDSSGEPLSALHPPEPTRTSNPVRPSFSSIMNQVRSSTSTRASPPRSANHSPPGNSPMEATSNCDSDSQSDLDISSVEQKPTLTLEQKTKVQKHIRNYLRPLYKPGKSHSRIANEEQYIHINKSVSRKVYSYLLSLSSPENGSIHVTFINDYLHDQVGLKQTVDRFVEEELRLNSI